MPKILVPPIGDPQRQGCGSRSGRVVWLDTVFEMRSDPDTVFYPRLDPVFSQRLDPFFSRMSDSDPTPRKKTDSGPTY